VKSDDDVVISSKASDLRSTRKGIAEWINEKSEAFVCSALKTSPQKHRLEKIKYTFDLTFCDELFDILLEQNFIKPLDHKVLMSSLDAKEQDYCKLHNSFNHSTQNCNMFRQIIQSAINSGRLKFAHAQENDQLKSIGLDDKKLQNWPASASSCNNENIGEEEDSNFLNNENIVHELQVKDVLKDDELSEIPGDTGGQPGYSQSEQEPITPAVLAESVRPVPNRSDRLPKPVRPVLIKDIQKK